MMNAISVYCKIGTAGVERQQRVKLLLLRNRKKRPKRGEQRRLMKIRNFSSLSQVKISMPRDKGKVKELLVEKKIIEKERMRWEFDNIILTPKRPFVDLERML